VADSTSWGESPEMCRKTHTATLTPAGLAIDGVEIGATKIIVTARPSTKIATCPECGVVSGRIHSRYRRRLIDLPAHGRVVEINVETRRFRCVGTGCRRRIFVQRLGDAVALPSARRTERMDGIVHRLGLAHCPRRRTGDLPQPREHPRAVRRDARRALDGRLPEWRRTLGAGSGYRDSGDPFGSSPNDHPPPPR
jgi:transposase